MDLDFVKPKIESILEMYTETAATAVVPLSL